MAFCTGIGVLLMLIYIIYLVSITHCLKIVQNENGKPNVTTLYPVDNITYYIRETHNVQKSKVNAENEKDNKIQLTNNTTDNKIKEHDPKENLNHSSKLRDELENEIRNKNEDEKILQEKANKKGVTNLFSDTTTWKVNATYTKSKLNENRNNIPDYNLVENENNKGKEFKPSPHLGSFFDEESFVIPTQATVGPFTPVVSKPSLEFVSSPRDFFQLEYKQPMHTYHDTIDSPYKFENIVPRTKDWKFETGLETKPTMEAPLMIPAGGLYKLPDVFKEKPSSDGDNDDFGLDFKDSKDTKDTSIRKRENPWRKILNLVTALIPVGIIISALTPNIVTLETTDNNPRFPSRVSRRSEESVTELPLISEQCKRRLLCELHSDGNYIRNPSPHRPNLCYKIPCNDPQALNKVLRWLLLHHDHRSYRHTLHDRRGFIT